MRTKNDTLIKSFILPQTMYLSNEEFGLIVRCLMINDDYEEQRLKRADEITSRKYLEKEKQWIDDFNERREDNGLFEAAVSIMHGQIQNSHDAFDRLMENYTKKNEAKPQKEEKPKKEDNYILPNFQKIKESMSQAIVSPDMDDLTNFYRYIIKNKINTENLSTEEWETIGNEFLEEERIKGEI